MVEKKNLENISFHSPVTELRQRLEESRRMRNAIQRYVAGLAHDDAHLGQIAEILRQARQARTELAMI